jgi:hypothetical protein
MNIYPPPMARWDDCARWSKLENVVLSGGGTINGDGDQWSGYSHGR